MFGIISLGIYSNIVRACGVLERELWNIAYRTRESILHLTLRDVSLKSVYMDYKIHAKILRDFQRITKDIFGKILVLGRFWDCERDFPRLCKRFCGIFFIAIWFVFCLGVMHPSSVSGWVEKHTQNPLWNLQKLL